jgi:SepF-like predicted cell division protein (DUF552 family)
MPLKRIKNGIFGRGRAEAMRTEDYVEVDVMGFDDKKTGKFGIQIEKLDEFADTDRILRSIREGHIIFLKIKGLKEKDMGELKRAIDKLKRSVVANNGDIVGVEQDWLILTPEYIVVHR